MAFSNPIWGNNGALLIPAVKSPNYTAGVSGWSINRDGSAEFNDVTVRVTAGLTLENNPDVQNGGSATYSVRNLLYWFFGNLVWFNLRIVAASAGSGASNLTVDPVAFEFENTGPNGESLPQIFAFRHTGLNAGTESPVNGHGVAVTAGGIITQLVTNAGNILQGQDLANGSVLTVMGWGLMPI